jgi:hypothetical protein
MPNWLLPLLALMALLAFFYFAFLHKPLAPPSGRENKDDGGMGF